MKISCNWLSDYINLDASPDPSKGGEKTPSEIAELLTGCGLEVASVQEYNSVKGGMEGLVVGEVKEKQSHPNADRLTVAVVDYGADEPLAVVTGAPNLKPGDSVLLKASRGLCLEGAFPIIKKLWESSKGIIEGEGA